jgi:hypothetical protein
MKPDNDMGSPDNITTATLKKAAMAGGNRNLKDLMANMVKTYNAEIKGKPSDTELIKKT